VHDVAGKRGWNRDTWRTRMHVWIGFAGDLKYGMLAMGSPPWHWRQVRLARTVWMSLACSG
jgi:hypothetical protein